MSWTVALLILCLWLWPGALKAETFEDGLHAFRSGQAELARDIWLPMAETGHAAAQYSLGKLYEQGEGTVQPDHAAAVRWYSAAAVQNLPAAQNNLALMYAKGRGVPQDVKRALELWRSAARLDYPWAQYNLGLAYFQGKGTKRDEKAALGWIRRAADGGLAEAQFIMGLLYRDGLIVAEDRGRAMTWYTRAAEQGHLRARQQVKHLEALQVTPQPVGEPEATPQALAGEGAGDGGQVAVGRGLLEPEPENSVTPASDGTWSPPTPRVHGLVPQVSAKAVVPAKPVPPQRASDAVVQVTPQVSAEAAAPAETMPQQQAAVPAAQVNGGTAGPAPVLPSAVDDSGAASQGDAQPVAAQPEAAGVAPSQQTKGVPAGPESPQPATLDATLNDMPQPAIKPKAILAAKGKLWEEASAGPVSSQVAALSDAPRTTSAGVMLQQEAVKPGVFRIWLASAGSEAEAAALWQQTRQEHPNLLARAEASFSLVELGGGQTLYRILAGPLASSSAALHLCQQLRVERPGAFCQVRPD